MSIHTLKKLYVLTYRYYINILFSSKTPHTKKRPIAVLVFTLDSQAQYAAYNTHINTLLQTI